LRINDFHLALQDVYDFFFDVNQHLTGKGLQRLDDMLRPAMWFVSFGMALRATSK